MNHLDVQRIVDERAKMLSSIAHDISSPLLEALKKKLAYEHASLLAIIESDTKADAARKDLNKTLKAEYFIQKTLDVSHI